MNKLFYPAIFHLTEEGGFGISFPDLPECFFDGDNIVEAYDMASDALVLALSTHLADKEMEALITKIQQVSSGN